MATLTIRQLRKRFGAVEVLKGVDLEAKQGEFIALVGPSGCGKSTMLAIIAGLETASGGEIRIDDRVVNSVAPKDRDIAMVFQSYALYPTMTARQNITFGMESRGVPKAQQDDAVKRVASLLQIEPLLGRKPGQLSGGQRQRVAMGRALVRDPKLFLFDEPLSNLDAKLRVEMRTEIKKLHQRVGQTTIYVTHDQIEAMTLASRIAVLNHGALQQFDAPQTVYDRPANMFVASFMGSPSMNFIPATLIASGAGLAAEISDANGKPVALALPGATGAMSAGMKVTLGVRPEHVTLVGDGAPGSVASMVDVVEPTGAETIAALKIAEASVIGRFPPDKAPKTGKTATLAFDMGRACVFDPASQALIS